MIERQSDDWVLISVQSDEGEGYALWRFVELGIVHATNNETGNLEDLRSSKFIDVYVRK